MTENEKKIDNQLNADELPAISNCLAPLLKALNWRGGKRHLNEAMPHISHIHTEPMFCNVMKNLNYHHKKLKIKLKNIDERLLPCLLVLDKNTPFVLLKKSGDTFEVFDGQKNAVITIGLSDSRLGKKGSLYAFKAEKESEAVSSLEHSWIRKTFQKNRGLFWGAFFLSFMVNLLMLATPLYVMSVYDRVVSTGSYQMLFEFVLGIVIVLLGVIALHRIRAKIIALFGARLDREIGTNIFERLLYLSPAYTETATVGAQVARIKDFDRLRQFMAGPLLTTFFDLPYVLLAMVLIGLLAGSLVIVPILMIVVFLVLGFAFHLKVQKEIRLSSFNGTRQQEFILEAIGEMRAVKYLGAEEKWMERYRAMSAETNAASMRVSVLGAINAAFSDSIMIGSGMAVIAIGAVSIIDQTMSIGGMLATMILIWRVLAPIKTVFNMLPRLQQMLSSLKQINRLMKIEPEAEATELLTRKARSFKGKVAFHRVSFRYQAAMDPALMGAEFEVNSGELVGIVGKNGSGKSTLLKMILGLYMPQAGAVLIDNQDIRQLNPIELRNSVGYVPQKPELFYGSIASNLRLGKPDVTMNEMIEATKAAGIYDDIMLLPQQFDESIRDFSFSQLSASFQQGLCLARTYLKKSNIMLLDEPAGILDDKLDAAFTSALEMCRGKITLFMVSHRPSHLKLCDKLLLIDQGQVLLFGPTNEVLPKIPKEYL